MRGCRSRSWLDAQRLKPLEAENTKLKKLLANSMLEIDAMREVLNGK